MVVKSSEAFYTTFLNALSFTEEKHDNFILYHNKAKPELGYIVRYSKKNYYDIFLGNYTIPEDFSITFNNPSTHMRFGTVYSGITKFRLVNEPISSFKPSSFFSLESQPQGKQVWHKGQHFHGTEVTLYRPYFEEIIYPIYGNTCVSLEDFTFNATQLYLPLEVVKILHQLERMSTSVLLSNLYIDSKILECLAIITAESQASSKNAFTNRYAMGQITLGSSRKINLSASDVEAIRKAYEIMTEHACNPPTIEHLSSLVQLNPQKLKAGFVSMYHSTIWEYANTVRMSIATHLLATTELSIKEIAQEIGYVHCGNFTHMFKRSAHMSPREFRKSQVAIQKTFK